MKKISCLLIIAFFAISCQDKNSETRSIEISSADTRLRAIAEKYQLPSDFLHFTKTSGKKEELEVILSAVENAAMKYKQHKDSVNQLIAHFKKIDDKILAEFKDSKSPEENQKIFEKYKEEMSAERPQLVIHSFNSFLDKEKGIKPIKEKVGTD